MKKKFILFSLLTIFMPLQVLAYSNYIIPGGENIGIEVYNKGIMVVGFYKVNGAYPKTNLEAGDSIIKVGNENVNTVNELINAIDKNIKNNIVEVTFVKDNKEYKTDLEVTLFDGIYKTGLYVKDSLNGIGTLTYIDPESKIYGALGHEILESNTNKRIEVKTGNIFDSEVVKIVKSTDGVPGSKKAKIDYNTELGTVTKNTGSGIFGLYSSNLPLKDAKKVADISEVELGKAVIYTVVNGKEEQEYVINISKIDKDNKIKNFYFEIEDEKLLNETGGVVQGMSGSPIIQNDKIIGAVTHVIVDDVKKGYGISIVTMLEEGER